MSQAHHEAMLSEWREKMRDGVEGHFGGHRIFTAPNVFPSHLGSTSRDVAKAALILQHLREHCEPSGERLALDMGCGNGSQALVLAALDVNRKVIAVDKDADAVKNTQYNVNRSRYADKIEVHRSDLLADIAGLLPQSLGTTPPQFDTIIFNQPYYPREEPAQFGLGREGGRPLIRRFFAEIEPFIHSRTEILMPFSNGVAAEHNPASVANACGYCVVPMHVRRDQAGETHVVYLFTRQPFHPGCFAPYTIDERLTTTEILERTV